MAQRTALIVGGTGQIGLATASALGAAGWRVILGSRGSGAAGFEHVRLDRESPGELSRALGHGVDALIDTVAFDAGHASQLLEIEADVGAMVVISSASVYRDNAGRTLDEARRTGFPAFPTPIVEDQPTVSPGPETYSTRKAALEQALLQRANIPVTIFRPGAIHGAGSSHAREWFFVKRISDGRRAVPLAFGGASRFHTTAAINIARLIESVLAKPETQVLNIADPAAPSVSEIGAAIASHQGAELELIPFEGAPVGGVGQMPWSVPAPVVLSTARAEARGYRPAATFSQAVGAACDSVAALAAAGAAFPAYIEALFDYAAEDAWLAGTT